MKSIKAILMNRDGLTEYEADDLIAQAKEDVIERVEAGDFPLDACEQWFGLEPDYLEELVF